LGINYKESDDLGRVIGHENRVPPVVDLVHLINLIGVRANRRAKPAGWEFSLFPEPRSFLVVFMAYDPAQVVTHSPGQYPLEAGSGAFPYCYTYL